MSGFIKKARSAVEKLIAPRDRVLVAVSGGVDSLALLYLLHHFSKDIGFKLFVAHLNHLSRKKESYEDARFVKGETDKLSLPCFIGEVDVGKEKSKLKTSFQEAARILRYQFLEKTLLSIDGDKIAVGHNADDHIETILINLLRGTGLRGLSGIREKRGNIIRPILKCTRAELELYLKKQNHSYRTDTSNKDKKYLRNEIRHDLIPFLRKFNNNISNNLADLAGIVREEDELISGIVRDLYSKIVVTETGKRKLNFKIHDFQKQVSAIKKRLAREAVEEIKGNLRSITTAHIRQILDLFSRARVGSRLKLPGNVIVVCGYDAVSFFLSDKLELPEACSSEMDQESIRLKIPGETSLFEGRLQIYTEFAEPPIIFPTPINTMQAYLDFDKTGEVIHARFFQPGDHFVPLGMRGHKKLKSYFIDRKIPRERRSNIPILTNAEDDIIWVYGERISERFRVTNSTKKVLIIEGKGL